MEQVHYEQMYATSDCRPDDDRFVTGIIGHQQANRIEIPPDAKLNTSIYEEAEVVI